MGERVGGRLGCNLIPISNHVCTTHQQGQRHRAVAIGGGGGGTPPENVFGKITVLSANRIRNQRKYLCGSDEKVIVIAKNLINL